MRPLRILSFLFLLITSACAGSTSPTVVDGKTGTADTPSAQEALAETPLHSPSTQPPRDDTTDRETCCAQCLDAASKDPAGRDLSMNSCSGYAGYMVNGSAPLNNACSTWFETNAHTVADCRSPRRTR